MTKDQIVAQLSSIQGHPWKEPQWNNFLGAELPEQELMLQIFEDSTEPAVVNGWATALTALTEIATIAGDVAGVAGGVQAVATLVKTLKAA